jgi:hypothetical protein
LRRSDLIRNSCSAGPKTPNYGDPEVGIPGAVWSNFALDHGRRERNFWVQRQGARNRHENARTPAETKFGKGDAENPPRSALFGVVPETCGLRRLDGGVRSHMRTGLHIEFPANREKYREFRYLEAFMG